jgi:hypothetical protein
VSRAKKRRSHAELVEEVFDYLRSCEGEQPLELRKRARMDILVAGREFDRAIKELVAAGRVDRRDLSLIPEPEPEWWREGVPLDTP